MAPMLTTLRKTLSVLVFTLVVAACGGAEPKAPVAPEARIYRDIPSAIDPSARHLIYLHGRIIEDQGVRPTHPRFGVYEYEEILKTLAGRGLVVISESRPPQTDVGEYAVKVAAQVTALIDAGVPPEHITVVGFSKGGEIAILASSLVANDLINFVFMASCGPRFANRPEIVPRGRLLGIREASDDLAGSCDELFARSPPGSYRAEIVLELGGGHGAFYRPHPEWVEPVVAWALASNPASD